MDAVTTIPAARIAEIQKDAKAAVSAEARLRKAYVTVFKSLYQFGQDFGEAPVKVELASKGITVRSDAQHPHWVGVCKLAFGADEGYAQQVNKYSNVLAYAEATTVKLEEIDGWLGDKTLTSKIQAARLYFGKTESGGGQSKTQKLLTQEIEKIEEAWEPLLSEIDGMPSSVRLDEIKAAGIKIEPGRVEILAEMDAEGNLVPIGIIQAKDEKLYDLIKPRAVRRASSALHTLDHVTDLYAFADVIPMGTKKPRSLIVKPNFCSAAENMFPHQRVISRESV